MKIHIVKQGDTLYALSQKYGVSLQKIIEANPQISNPDVLVLGDKVKIPSAPTPVLDNSELFYKHTVKQGDTLWKLSKAWGITLKEIIDANPQLKNPNALLTGEIVNIPKKSNATPIQPQSTQTNTTPIQPEATSPAVVDKTKVGGKTYTGPKEEAVQEAVPLPAPVPEPVISKEPEANIAPEVKTAPEVKKAPEVNIAPEVVNIAPVNKAPEVSPVQMVHESQSLYVQISVPAQEAVAYEMPKEKGKTEVQQAYWTANKEMPCDKTAGYPGLNENPYVFDCPQGYPYYEQEMPVMGMNPAQNYIQPAAYMQECPPYMYPGNMYPVAEVQEPWYPNYTPDYSAAPLTGVSPAVDYPPYGVPQFGGPTMNLPWPSCGCGGEVPMHSYGYEQPAFGGYPVYMPQPGVISPYGVGGDTLPNAAANFIAPYGTYENSPISGIPAYPSYPGMENFAHHNRIPEILEPEPIELHTPQAAVNTAEAVTKTKNRSSKTGAAKVKTSSFTGTKSGKPASKQGGNQNSRSGSAKKSKNPWISN